MRPIIAPFSNAVSKQSPGATDFTPDTNAGYRDLRPLGPAANIYGGCINGAVTGLTIDKDIADALTAFRNCRWKKAYFTFAAAIVRFQVLCQTPRPNQRITIYQCKHCDWYHVGNSTGKKQNTLLSSIDISK